MDLGYKLAEHPKDLTRLQISFLMAALSYRNELAAQQRLAAEGVSRIMVTEDEEEEET